MVYPLFQKGGGQPLFSGIKSGSGSQTLDLIAAPAATKKIAPVWMYILISGTYSMPIEVRGKTSGVVLLGNDDGSNPGIISGYADYVFFDWGFRHMSTLSDGEALELYVLDAGSANAWKVGVGYYLI